MIDRLPPQKLEAEQSVLGAILIDRDAVIEVAEFLRPADFLSPGERPDLCRRAELFERREPIDIVTVAEALERKDELEAIGGRPPLEPLERDADRRPRRAVRPDRRAQGSPAQPHRRCRPDRGHRLRGPAEIQEAIDRAEAELFAVSQKRVDAGFSPLKSLLHDAYDRLDYLHAHRGEISGVRTGFTDLDTLTTGLQKSDPIVLAARPSVGKTSFASTSRTRRSRSARASACSASR